MREELTKLGLYREDLAVSGQLEQLHSARMQRLYREDLAVSGQRNDLHSKSKSRLYREDLAVSGQHSNISRTTPPMIIPRGFGGIRTTRRGCHERG